MDVVLDPDERNEVGKELVWLFPHIVVPLDHYRDDTRRIQPYNSESLAQLDGLYIPNTQTV